MAQGQPGRQFFCKDALSQSLTWAILSLGLSPCAGTYPLLLGVSLSGIGEVHVFGEPQPEWLNSFSLLFTLCPQVEAEHLNASWGWAQLDNSKVGPDSTQGMVEAKGK